MPRARSARNRFIERTLVLVKPDGVKRGLVGEIVQRFERMGLKIIAMKMVWVDEQHVAKHYPDSRIEFLKGMGMKTLDSYAKYGLDVKQVLGTDDPIAIGRQVNKWNRDFLVSGPVVAMVLEGLHAIENVRQLAGHTIPTMAAPGTIRGDHSVDSPALANERRRTVRNLMHASGNLAEAQYEIDLWFKGSELHDYKRADEDVMF